MYKALLKNKARDWTSAV